MRPRRPIRNALRHWCGLGPHNLATKPPAVSAKRKSGHPRDTHEVFRLQPRHVRCRWSPLLEAVIRRIRRLRAGGDFSLRSVAAILTAIVAPTTTIRISEIQPTGRIVSQHALQLGKDLNEMLDVKIGCWLEAEASTPCATETERGEFRLASRRGFVQRLGNHRVSRLPVGRWLQVRFPLVFTVNRFIPYRRLYAVISQAPIWRRCHGTMH